MINNNIDNNNSYVSKDLDLLVRDFHELSNLIDYTYKIIS